MMTRLLPCFTVAVATATATTTRVTMDDEPAFFAAALARDDAAARWRAGRRLAAVARPRGGATECTSAVEDGFAFSWAVSPARALSEKPILHMAGAAGRCGHPTLRAPAATSGFFKNEWVLRSPVHALCRDPAEFDYARPRARMQL